MGRLHRLEQTWRVVADGLGCGAGAAGRHPGQGRGSPKPEKHRDTERARLYYGKPEARATDKELWGRGGGGEPRRSGRLRAFPIARGQRPGRLACGDHAAAPPAAEPARPPRSTNHPPARGSRCPARPPRPPGSHLLVGCGEVLSDHGTKPAEAHPGPQRSGGARSVMCPFL